MVASRLLGSDFVGGEMTLKLYDTERFSPYKELIQILTKKSNQDRPKVFCSGKPCREEKCDITLPW